MQKEVAWTRRLSDGDGFLVIHHGETAESCNRGRSGVAGNRWLVGPAQQKRAGACGAVVGRGGEDPHGLQRLCTDRKLVTAPPFAIGKPFVRQPRGDTRLTPENAS